MYYKNFNTIGIRQKFGKKKQVMSFGGKKSSFDEAALRGFGDTAMKKLDDDMSLEDVRAWLSEVMV